MGYWFMRMKQGSEGKPLPPELWDKDLIGVMFGRWTIDYVLTDGDLDKGKVTFERLQKYPPSGEPEFNKNWFHSARRFLVEMLADDKVVVEFGDSLHIATVTDEFKGDPNPALRDYGEHFKCRRIRSKKRFAIEKLPSSYRLISGTGRGAVQRINAYRPLVELLDRCDSPEEVTEECRKMSTERFMTTLSPKQWETVCAEYLRDTEGVRPLLLALGSTLKDVDIYGVNRRGERVLAQCKNDATKRKAEIIEEWAISLAASPEDILYFFARGGVDRQVHASRCTVIDGEEILRWLGSQGKYQEQLKIL